MTKYIVGLDLGQAQDFTAISVLEAVPEADGGRKVYGLKHLERFKEVPYPRVVRRVQEIVTKLGKDVQLVVDGTGVGAAPVDMLRATGLCPIDVRIHGGDRVVHEGASWRVPKRDLVGVLQVVMQTGRLKIPSKLKLAQLFQAELLNFRVKIDPQTAHDSYSAWREQEHDDLVLSVALACWCGECCSEPTSTCRPVILRQRGGARWDW